MRVEALENPGNFKVYVKLRGIERLTKRATRQGMFLWARDLKATANAAILAKDKVGRIYIRRDSLGRRRRHRASAPGQSHANLTGALRKSIGWTVTGSDRLVFGYGVSGRDTPNYDVFVEFGTKGRISESKDIAAVGPRQFRMAPRPSIQNAIEKTTSNAETYFEGELKKLL